MMPLWARSLSWTSVLPLATAERVLDPLGRGLAVAVGDGHWVLGRVDGDRDARLLFGKPPLARLPASLGEVGVVGVDLVDPDAAFEDDTVLKPSTVAKTRWRHSKAVWWVMPHSSAHASMGTFQVMSPTKCTHVAKSFLQFSKSVPSKMPKSIPHSAHLSFRCPARSCRLWRCAETRSAGSRGAVGTPPRPRRRCRSQSSRGTSAPRRPAPAPRRHRPASRRRPRRSGCG